MHKLNRGIITNVVSNYYTLINAAEWQAYEGKRAAPTTTQPRYYNSTANHDGTGNGKDTKIVTIIAPVQAA